jgi:hypothetical protein
MTDPGDRGMVQEWLENKRYSRKELLTVARNNKWRKRKQYMVPETSKLPLTRKQKYTLLSLIPRTLTALLRPGELMAGTQIEEFLSHLVSSNINMLFMATYFGPSLRHQGQLYWGCLMGTKNVKYAKKATDVKDIMKHILYIPWFTGRTNGGHWILIAWYKNTNGKVAFYHMDSLNNFDNSAPYALSNTPIYS